MKIRIGYDMAYQCPQPTPMILMLNIHYSRMADVVTPDQVLTDPPVALTAYRDGFGNWCSRIVAPKGRIRIFADGVVRDSGSRVKFPSSKMEFKLFTPVLLACLVA